MSMEFRLGMSNHSGHGKSKQHHKKKSSTSVTRVVSFGEKSLRTVEPVDQDMKNEMWYSSSELDSLRKQEIKKNRIVQNELLSSSTSPASSSSPSSSPLSSSENPTSTNRSPSTKKSLYDQIISHKQDQADKLPLSADLNDELTWRGLEDVQLQQDRLEKIRFYVRTIVREHQDDATAGELKRIAKAMSKTERVKAHNWALKDQMMVLGTSQSHQNLLQSSSSSSSSLGVANKRKLFGRTFSGSASWINKRSLYRNTTLNATNSKLQEESTVNASWRS